MMVPIPFRRGTRQRSPDCSGTRQRSPVCSGTRQRSPVCSRTRQRSPVCSGATLACLAFLLAALQLNSASEPPRASASSPWGAGYFPNVTLTTHDGKEVRFFDDLIKGKIVAINFIYTHCPDTCPLETAQLTRVQELLGDRLGKDVHFYSITLDPERDTPEVLSAYREKFRARWTFLTGSIEDIFTLQKKLGLFLEEIRDGLNNHNVSMIIGNQATGRWMKRSPHENPHVLADQIGNWLDGWKRPPELDTYANAPTLRDISPGEQLYRTRCASCHSLSGNEPANALGPDLIGVTERRAPDWLLEWLRAPDEMLAKGDPIATALFEKYNRLAMPNLRLNRQEAGDLIDYLTEESRRILGRPLVAYRKKPNLETDPAAAFLEVESARILPGHPSSLARLGELVLRNPGTEAQIITAAHSEAFRKVGLHQLSSEDGQLRRMPLDEISIPPSSSLKLGGLGPHLVFGQPGRPLKEGEEISLTLVNTDGRQQKVPVEVSARQR